MISLTDLTNLKQMSRESKYFWLKWHADEVIQSLDRMFALEETNDIVYSLLIGDRHNKLALAIECLLDVVENANH